MRSGPVIQRVEAKTLPTPYSAQGGPHCRGLQVSSEAEAPRQGRLCRKPSPSSLAQRLQSHLTRSAPPVFSSLGTT